MATKHVNLRLEPELHSRLLTIAERNRRSANAHLIWMMEHDPEFVAEAEKAAARNGEGER